MFYVICVAWDFEVKDKVGNDRTQSTLLTYESLQIFVKVERLSTSFICWSNIILLSTHENIRILHDLQLNNFGPADFWINHSQTYQVNFCPIFVIETVQALWDPHIVSPKEFQFTSFAGTLQYLHLCICLLGIYNSTWQFFWRYCIYLSNILWCRVFHTGMKLLGVGSSGGISL